VFKKIFGLKKHEVSKQFYLCSPNKPSWHGAHLENTWISFTFITIHDAVSVTNGPKDMNYRCTQPSCLITINSK